MVRFKYKDKIIETPNLEKKLKRMKITSDDIQILDSETQEVKKEDDDTPQWKLDGYIKHCWINNDESSKEYKWSIIGFHKPGDKMQVPKRPGWNSELVLYSEEK